MVVAEQKKEEKDTQITQNKKKQRMIQPNLPLIYPFIHCSGSSSSSKLHRIKRSRG